MVGRWRFPILFLLGFPMHSPGSSWGSDLSSEARNYLQFHSGRCITPRGFTIDDTVVYVYIWNRSKGEPSCGPPECWRAWSKAEKKTVSLLNEIPLRWLLVKSLVSRVASCVHGPFLPHARQIPISKKLCAQKITGCWICKVRIWIWY